MKNKLAFIKNKNGSTFVEVMLAVAILAIIAAPLLSAVISSVRNNSAAKEKTEAITMAEVVMDNLKAQPAISTKAKTQFSAWPKSTLAAYYTITSKGASTITKSGESNYIYDNTKTNKKTDLELVIDQKMLSSGEFDITVKDGEGNIVGSKMSLISVNDKLELILYDNSFLLKTDKGQFVGDVFTKLVNEEISVKVNYEDSSDVTEPIKINVNDMSNLSTKLNIYIVNSSEHQPGVKFINEGSTKNFDIEYIDSSKIDYTKSINELFDITVTIQRKSDSSKVYEVSSYVKK